MAKYVIEFDTVEKTLAVTRDGAAINNVTSVDICQKPTYYDPYSVPEPDEADEYCFGLTIGDMNASEGERSYTRVTASEMAPQEWVTFTIPGLSVAPTSLEERIGAFLGSKR